MKQQLLYLIQGYPVKAKPTHTNYKPDYSCIAAKWSMTPSVLHNAVRESRCKAGLRTVERTTSKTDPVLPYLVPI